MNQVFQSIMHNPALGALLAFIAGIVITLSMLPIFLARARSSSANKAQNTAQTKHQLLSNELAIATVERDHAKKEIDNVDVELQELRKINQDLEKRDAELSTRIEENKKSFLEKEQLLKENGEHLKKEFERLADKVLSL
ncbi:MAG: hypothetical protein KUG75_04410, partial [Pseudomonadales bacterium]|nr:hypothetical protein [Pseudomonadales bacterium]